MSDFGALDADKPNAKAFVYVVVVGPTLAYGRIAVQAMTSFLAVRSVLLGLGGDEPDQFNRQI